MLSPLNVFKVLRRKKKQQNHVALYGNRVQAGENSNF